MQAKYITRFPNNVNSSTPENLNIPNIWDRNFKKFLTELGAQHKIYIDPYKYLRKILGRDYDLVGAVTDLARRFGNGFHHSDEEMLDFMDHNFSHSTLKRRKADLHKKNIINISHTTKNRSVYTLNESWFKNIIYGLLIELGVQQAQNEPSHIISNEYKIINNHNHIDLNENDDLEHKLRYIETLEAAQEYETMLSANVVKKKHVSPAPSNINAIETKQVIQLKNELLAHKVDCFSVYRWLKEQPLWFLLGSWDLAKQKNNPGGYFRCLVDNKKHATISVSTSVEETQRYITDQDLIQKASRSVVQEHLNKINKQLGRKNEQPESKS